MESKLRNCKVGLIGMGILLSSALLTSCGERVQNLPIVSKLADEKLIGWDNARVTDDASIVTYAGKPFKKVSSRDKLAERAVEAYCKWKGGTSPFLPVKTAVGERVVEDWRAIALPSGEVFIVGGAFKEPPGVIDQTWLLEPKTSRLKDGPQLLRARKACTLSYLSSGKILVSGGLDGSAEPISDCECFDPKTQAMSKFSPLKMPRNGHSVIELGNNHLIVVNGKTKEGLADSSGKLSTYIETWKPEENAFSLIGKTRKARFEPQLFLIDSSRVLIAKGHMFSGDIETSEVPPAEVYVEKVVQVDTSKYKVVCERADSSGNSYKRHYCDDVAAKEVVWSLNKRQLMPQSSYLRVKTAVGEQELTLWSAIKLPSGKIFIVGGVFVEQSDGATNHTWFLDPKTKKVVDGPHMLTARRNATLTNLLSGKVLISGGMGSDLKNLKSCEIYDPKTGKISKFFPMESERSGHEVAETDDGTLLVFGGSTEYLGGDAQGGLWSTIEEWKPGQEGFRIIGRMNQAQTGPTLYVDTENQVLVSGGTYFTGQSDTSIPAGSELYRGSKNSKK